MVLKADGRGLPMEGPSVLGGLREGKGGREREAFLEGRSRVCECMFESVMVSGHGCIWI